MKLQCLWSVCSYHNCWVSKNHPVSVIVSTCPIFIVHKHATIHNYTSKGVFLLFWYDFTKRSTISSCPAIGGAHDWFTELAQIARRPVGPLALEARINPSAKHVRQRIVRLHTTSNIRGTGYYLTILTYY